MKIRSVEVRHCDAGWRPWSFVKLTTEDGVVGWSECTDSHGSPRGLAGIVADLAPLLVGKDATAYERRLWELQSATRQTPGGLIQKAIGGIENALLDVTAKALDVPVHTLLGGPVRDSVDLYWSHCGTTRVRAAEVAGVPPVRTADDLTALAREVTDRGFGALKTNILLLDGTPTVYMPGFNKSGGGPDRNPDRAVIAGLRRSLEALRAGVPDDFDLIVDLNFNFRVEGYHRVLREVADLDLAWVELDVFEPAALRELRDRSSTAICSGENLYGLKAFLPYFQERAMDVASIDVLWNGLRRSVDIAVVADAHELNVSPHNYYSHLATMMSASLCAVAPNVRMMEVDVDDVPWKDDLVTVLPDVRDGALAMPSGPGWGTDVVEEVLDAHPWPRA